MTPIKHAVLVLAIATVIAALIVKFGLDQIGVQPVDCPSRQSP